MFEVPYHSAVKLLSSYFAAIFLEYGVFSCLVGLRWTPNY